jgi:hypothetical protein
MGEIHMDAIHDESWKNAGAMRGQAACFSPR